MAMKSDYPKSHVRIEVDTVYTFVSSNLKPLSLILFGYDLKLTAVEMF